jgi:hypothetical protein
VRLTILLPITLAMAIPLSLVGCGDDETGETTGGSAKCYDYSSFDSMSPAVQFQADVLPIFQQACGLSASCHGDGAPAAQPYLGATTSPDVMKIFDMNVNVDSMKEPGMKIIAPGDPEHSFLMHKMDGTLQCELLKCGTACGGSMPLLAQPRPIEDRDKVRRWIAQGAKND